MYEKLLLGWVAGVMLATYISTDMVWPANSTVVQSVERVRVVLVTNSVNCPPCVELHKKMTPGLMAKVRKIYDVRIIDTSREISDSDKQFLEDNRVWGTPTVIVNGKKFTGTSGLRRILKLMEEVNEKDLDNI